MEQSANIPDKAVINARSILIDFSNKLNDIDYDNNNLTNEIILAIRNNPIITTIRIL